MLAIVLRRTQWSWEGLLDIQRPAAVLPRRPPELVRIGVQQQHLQRRRLAPVAQSNAQALAEPQ